MTEATEQRDERSSRVGLRSALATVAPLVTLSRDGLVLVALAGEIDRPPAYETATAATARGDLELRELEVASGRGRGRRLVGGRAVDLPGERDEDEAVARQRHEGSDGRECGAQPNAA